MACPQVYKSRRALIAPPGWRCGATPILAGRRFRPIVFGEQYRSILKHSVVRPSAVARRRGQGQIMDSNAKLNILT